MSRARGTGIECALGGSGLLASLGLAETVHDWDMTTDAPPARVRDLLAHLESALCGSSGIHADHKLVLPGRRDRGNRGLRDAREGRRRASADHRVRQMEQRFRWAAPRHGRWPTPCWIARRSSALLAWLSFNGTDPEAVSRLTRESLDPEPHHELVDPPACTAALQRVNGRGSKTAGPDSLARRFLARAASRSPSSRSRASRRRPGRAEPLVEVDRGFVPVEHQPADAQAAALERDARQRAPSARGRCRAPLVGLARTGPRATSCGAVRNESRSRSRGRSRPGLPSRSATSASITRPCAPNRCSPSCSGEPVTSCRSFS